MTLNNNDTKRREENGKRAYRMHYMMEKLHEVCATLEECVGELEHHLNLAGIFTFPQEHLFRLEPDGSYVMSESVCGQRKKQRCTVEHEAKYFDLLKEAVESYMDIVRRNTRANATYKKPTLELEKAREISRHAFTESFWKTKESYNKVRERNGKE